LEIRHYYSRGLPIKLLNQGTPREVTENFGWQLLSGGQQFYLGLEASHNLITLVLQREIIDVLGWGPLRNPIIIGFKHWRTQALNFRAGGQTEGHSYLKS